jgi:hypothetical protein
VSSTPNKANACFVENHPFLDFLICIILKSPQNLFSGNVYFYIIFYNLSYFEINIFDKIDNEIIMKRFQNIKIRR